MSLISRLERRFGWLAIPHLTSVLIAGQVALFAANLLPDGVSLARVVLDPQRVVDGEWWRLGTFLFVPPATKSILVIFYFMLMYLFGTTLEHHWGAFRFNLFLLIGYLANVGAAFIAWGLGRPEFGLTNAVGVMGAGPATNQFLYGSLFLAFARLYPDFIINLFYILPIRIKWLALLMWLAFASKLVTGDWMTRLLILATVSNYLLFFGAEHWREFRHVRRRRSFQTKAKKATTAPTHVCRVCGLASDASPKTQFRYCSKCEGQCCYCPDHIRNHEHVTAEAPATS